MNTGTITIHVSDVRDVDKLFDEISHLELKSATIDDSTTQMDQDEQLVVSRKRCPDCGCVGGTHVKGCDSVWNEVRTGVWIKAQTIPVSLIPFMWNEKPPNNKLHAEQHNRELERAYNEGMDDQCKFIIRQDSEAKDVEAAFAESQRLCIRLLAKRIVNELQTAKLTDKELIQMMMDRGLAIISGGQ